MKPRDYPYEPRSAQKLLPGEFWAIPLGDGTYGCGRVIQLSPGGVGSRSSFLAGVLDWRRPRLPTAEAIAGASCFKQGDLGVISILESGGRILGVRPLELDGIEPWLFRGANDPHNSSIQRGLVPIRPQRPRDVDLPVFSTWGYGVPAIFAGTLPRGR